MIPPSAYDTATPTNSSRTDETRPFRRDNPNVPSDLEQMPNLRSFLLDQGTLGARVQRDVGEAGRLGVKGTPTFFVNGLRIEGAQPAARFEQIIDKELAQLGTASSPPTKNAGARTTKKKGPARKK